VLKQNWLMESTSKAQLTDIWQKYKTALTRLDWALDELAKRPTVVQQPQVAQLTPAYPVPSPTDQTDFTIDGDPTDIRDMKPDDVHQLFIQGILPTEYEDLIKLEKQGAHIVSKAVTVRGESHPKLHNPSTLHTQYPDLENALSLIADNKKPIEANASFGSKYPAEPNKGDIFLRVDQLPTKLFKFNGIKWIELDKDRSSSYTYNDEYIKYLTAMIDNGQYDTELLSESERVAIDDFLKD